MGSFMKKILFGFLAIFSCAFAAPPQETKEQATKVEPVVILGSGVGALTSAIYLERAGIPTLVIEGPDPGGAIAQSPKVDNWPGEQEIDGRSLVDKIRSQAVANGATIVPEEVTSVDFSSSILKINTRKVLEKDKTRTIQARACIVATGSKPKLLGVPGESGDKGYWTKGVYSCAVCDGGLYKDKTVAVIGGGDAAITEANYLSNIAKKVYIVLRSDKFRTVETLRKNELVKKSNVEVLYNTKINEIQGNGQRVTHLNLSTENKLPIDGVFVAIGATPNTSMFGNQLALNTSGYISLKNDQQTSAPGIFAIGDVVDPVYKQAISAAGDGAKAALQVEGFLAGLPKEEIIQPKISEEVRIVKTSSESVKDISSKEEFYSAIGEGKTPVVFDFYSPYCGPCKQLLPQLEKLADEYKGKVRFLKVNVSQFSGLAETYNIFSVPTVLIFDKQGKVVGQATGLDDINKTLKNLDSIAAK